MITVGSAGQHWKEKNQEQKQASHEWLFSPESPNKASACGPARHSILEAVIEATSSSWSASKDPMRQVSGPIGPKIAVLALYSFLLVAVGCGSVNHTAGGPTPTPSPTGSPTPTVIP